MRKTETTVLNRHIEDGILWLTKNNPQDNFGMSVAMLKAMGEALHSISGQPDIRVYQAGH